VWKKHCWETKPARSIQMSIRSILILVKQSTYHKWTSLAGECLKQRLYTSWLHSAFYCLNIFIFRWLLACSTFYHDLLDYFLWTNTNRHHDLSELLSCYMHTKIVIFIACTSTSCISSAGSPGHFKAPVQQWGTLPNCSEITTKRSATLTKQGLSNTNDFKAY